MVKRLTYYDLTLGSRFIFVSFSSCENDGLCGFRSKVVLRPSKERVTSINTSSTYVVVTHSQFRNGGETAITQSLTFRIPLEGSHVPLTIDSDEAYAAICDEKVDRSD